MSTPAVPAALLALLLVFSAVPASAATGDPPPAATEEQQALEPRPDDAELGNFVTAFVRLIGVQHGYMMLLQNEEDPGRREELKASAYRDMESAVSQDGLSVERYNQIAVALQNDTELQGRVETMLQQLAESAEPAPDAQPGPDME